MAMPPHLHALNSQERSRDMLARAEASRLVRAARAARGRLPIWRRLRRSRRLAPGPSPAELPSRRATSGRAGRADQAV